MSSAVNKVNDFMSSDLGWTTGPLKIGYESLGGKNTFDRRSPKQPQSAPSGPHGLYQEPFGGPGVVGMQAQSDPRYAQNYFARQPQAQQQTQSSVKSMLAAALRGRMGRR